MQQKGNGGIDMRLCGKCLFLVDGTCKKKYQIEPCKKLNDYKRPTKCTKKKESVKKIRESKDNFLNKKLDELWGEIVRSKGYCELCGRKPPEVILHAHHIFSRRHFSTRWDIKNGVCLCHGCHIYKAHKDIQEFADWVQEHLGVEYVDEIRQKAHSTADFTKEEKREIIDKLKKHLTNETK